MFCIIRKIFSLFLPVILFLFTQRLAGQKVSVKVSEKNVNYNLNGRFDEINSVRLLQDESSVVQSSENRIKQQPPMLGYGITFDPGKKTSFSYDGRINLNFRNSDAENLNIIQDDGLNVLSESKNLTGSESVFLNLQQDFGFKIKLDTADSEIDNKISYTFIQNTQDQNITTHFIQPVDSIILLRGDNFHKRHFIVLQSDVVKLLPWQLKLESGIKTSWQIIESNTGYDFNIGGVMIADTIRSNTYDDDENITSLYIQLSRPLFAGFQLKAGLQLLSRQDTLHQKAIFSVCAQFHYGSIFAHSEAVENTAGSRPRGIEIDAVWQKISQRVWDNCNCYPKMGALLAYYDFDNQVLGHSLQAGYFLEPSFRIIRIWNISMRGVFGLSYNDRPHHPVLNPNNQSYSLPVNVYLALGIGNHIRLSRHWSAGFFFSYKHISNGGLKDPNKGINWIASSLSLNYTPEDIPLPTRSRKPFNKQTPFVFEISGFVSNRAARVGDKARHFIFGVGGQVSRQTGRLSSIFSGAEIYHDASIAERLYYNQVDGSPWRAGVFTGHQFLLGKFTFSQQIGVYVYQDNPYFDAWYHRWAVMYYMKNKYGVGFSLKAHRHVANFIDFRLSHRF